MRVIARSLSASGSRLLLAILALGWAGCGQGQALPSDRGSLRVAADAGALRACTLSGGCDESEVCAELDLAQGQVLRCVSRNGDLCGQQLACDPGFHCFAFASHPPKYFCGKLVPKDAGP